jgi:deoxycytidine triphosphate deaminase
LSQSARWIGERTDRHLKIESLSVLPMHEGGHSRELSSHELKRRVSTEFKILANVNSATINPKPFVERSLDSVRARSFIVPSNSFDIALSIEYCHVPKEVLTIYVGKSTCARCGIARKRGAIRAGVGRICNTRILQSHSSTGQGLRQRRALPDSVCPLRSALRDRLRRSHG